MVLKGDVSKMRRIALIVTVLLVAGLARADVEITLSQNGRVITIGYDASGEGQLVRAFALNVVATDGNIIDINDFAIGDNNGGYGIFPGAFAAAPISVNPTTGLVDSWNVAGYRPVAPAGDAEALGNIPGPGITIEMGSLYDDNPPGVTGVLCTITVDDNVSEVCVTGNAIRGNVVLEDASEAATNVDVTPGCVSCTGCEDCFPSEFAAYYDWVNCGKPDCWCAPPVGSGYQCDGDCDGATETFFKYRVFGNDLACVVENWKGKCSDPGFNPCADFDHKTETFFKYRVFGNDLAILVGNWKRKDSILPGDCPRDE